jgi:hypothetical protein
MPDGCSGHRTGVVTPDSLEYRDLHVLDPAALQLAPQQLTPSTSSLHEFDT